MTNRIRRHFFHEERISEALGTALLLSFSGGFQDAYTYIMRDHVFANAQTGNIVLMSTHLLGGEPSEAVRYLFPLLAFAGGVFAADAVKQKHKGIVMKTWKQTVVLIEMACLFAVGFMSSGINILANMLVSFACAMQVESFRRVNGNAYASTMCIGNLRSGTANLSSYLFTHERTYLVKAFDYFMVILVFACGAGIGGNICPRVGLASIWVCLPFLGAALLIMHREK